MIIALTGEKLAGKTTAAEYLATHHQAARFRFSQPLSDILLRLHQANTRKNLVALGQQLREIFGNDMLAKIMRDDLQQSTSQLKVIDGMRYLEEYNLLKELPDFTLVYITAPIAERYTRALARPEKTDEAGMTLEEFTAHERDTTEVGITELAQQAHSTIHNEGTLEELYSQLKTLVT